MTAMCENLFFLNAGTRIQPEKKIDMPIKNLCLKIWLAVPFLSPMDTLSKENMVGFFPSFACISFPIKIKYKLERHLDFSKTQSLLSTLPFFFFFKEKNLGLHIQTFL